MPHALETDILIQTTYGTVHYERGFEVVEIEGWVTEAALFIYVSGDPRRPARQQPHTAVPLGRIVEIEYIVADV